MDVAYLFVNPWPAPDFQLLYPGKKYVLKPLAFILCCLTTVRLHCRLCKFVLLFVESSAFHSFVCPLYADAISLCKTREDSQVHWEVLRWTAVWNLVLQPGTFWIAARQVLTPV